MSEREYYGKEQEKEEEKTREKQDEKWRRDPLSAVVWAAILIWIGVVLLLVNMRVLDDFTLFGARLEPWSVGFLGAGAIVLVEVLIRLFVPAYRRGVGGTLVFAFILLGVGFMDALGWELTGAIILIGIGVSMLLRGFLRRG